MGQLENDMILGTSAYKNGIRATMFTKKDSGIGYLVGAADDAQIVRTYYIDAQAAEKISLRARAAARGRRHASPATPPASPVQAPTRRADALLDDLLTVMPADEAKAWNDTLAARLADLDPASYDGWTGDQLTARPQTPRHRHRAGLGHRPGHRPRRQPARHHPRRRRRRARPTPRHAATRRRTSPGGASGWARLRSASPERVGLLGLAAPLAAPTRAQPPKTLTEQAF